MKKINMLWIIVFFSIVLLPNSLAATCVNYPAPFNPNDMSGWFTNIGTCTSVPNGVMTCAVDQNNCIPSDYYPRPYYDVVGIGCTCTCERNYCCGDGSINAIGEQCDNGTAVPTTLPLPGGVVPKNVWVNMSLNNDALACTSSCQINEMVIEGPYCGDDNIDLSLGEQCDNGTIINGQQCTPTYGGSCIYCSEGCTIETLNGGYCGDGMCQATNENINTCFDDCGNISGWHSSDNGWIVNEERRLVGTSGDAAINIYSDAFDVRLGGNYTLKANIINPNGCTVSVGLNDGSCLSADGWIQKTCFDDSAFVLSVSGNGTHVISGNIIDASSGFYKNVSLRIRVAQGCTQGVKFDNVSFKEVSTINAYHDPNLQPPINLTTACCPDAYCWDGSTCMASDPWYISTRSNLWSILDIESYYKTHVNSSLHWLSRGYRCMLNDTGYANWEPAQVKYDWNFEESGYCMRDTDCFVSNTFSGSDPTSIPGLISALGNSGSSCIRTGQFISDGYTLNNGNHYCMNGEWTTKTFLIANVLENLSADNPYILFCDDTGKTFNNLLSISEEAVPGGCVIIIKEGNNERIITGFYAESPLSESATNLMWQIYQKHIFDMTGQSFGIQQIVPQYVKDSYTNCDGADDNRTFVTCGIYQSSGRDLYLYHNNFDYYYILSNEPISEFNSNLFYNVWNSIVGFFQNLFGYEPEQPLGLAKQTNNYERLYVLNNNTLRTYGVEERKYDEELQNVMTLMYLNMTGPGIPEDNPFNIEYVNKTLNGRYYEFNSTPGSQTLLIKYEAPTELWKYLTAMLRDR